jgi:hypothetical protein
VSGARSYLEIGVASGSTFFSVDFPSKVAVDPSFQFNPEDRKAVGTYFFPVPSNLFFSMLQTQNHGLENAIPFDIIFIDGLHTFEQSLTDFENSLEYSHDNTLWLIDDTVPCDAYSSLPDTDMSIRLCQQAGLKGWLWHGDVYKTIFAIHDKYPEISYCTVSSGNPQTILWKSKGNKRMPAFSSLQEIADLNFYDIFEKAKLFMPVADDQFLDHIGSGLDPMVDAGEMSWLHLINNPSRFFKVARHEHITSLRSTAFSQKECIP